MACSGMLAGAYPSDEFAELKPRARVGPRDRHDRGPARRAGRRRHERRHDPGPRPVRRLHGGRGGHARSARRRARRGDGLRAPGRDARRRHRPRAPARGGSRRSATTGSRSARRPGVPGKLPFWKGDAVGRPIELGRALGRVRRRDGGRPRAAARRAADAATQRLREHHDLDERAAENLLSLPRGRARGDRRPADRQADRRRAVPRRARRLAADAADAVRRARPRAVVDGDRGAAAGAARAWRSRRSGPTTASRSACPRARRASTASRSCCSPMPTRSRTWSSGRSRTRRCSRAGSARTRRGPCSCRAAGRAPGRRCGSSASEPPTCWRSRAATAASRSSSRPTASACRTCSTSMRCARSWPASRAARSRSTASRRRRRARSRAACCSTTSRRTCTTAMRRWPSGEPARSRSTATCSASCSGRRSCASCSTPMRSPTSSCRSRRWPTTARRRRSTSVHDLLRRLGDLSTDEVAARVVGGAERPPTPWLAELAAARRAVRTRIAGDERWIAIEDVARYRDGVGVTPPVGVPEAFLGPAAGALDGLLARWARTHGPFLTPEPARRWGLPVRDRRGRAGAAARGRHDPARRVPAGRRGARMVRPGRAAAAPPALAGAAAPRGRAGRPGRARPLPAGLARRRPGHRPGCRAAAVPRLGRARAAGRGRRPAGRRGHPGVGPGARRPAGTGPGLPAAAARRARGDGRGGLGRARQPGPRRRPDRALPAGPRGAPAGRARRRNDDRRPPVRRAPRPDPRASRRARRELLSRAIHAAAGGGSDREMLDALWDLVWAGEVTNDTFAPLRALRWKRPPGNGAGARRGGRAG